MSSRALLGDLKKNSSIKVVAVLEDLENAEQVFLQEINESNHMGSQVFMSPQSEVQFKN